MYDMAEMPQFIYFPTAEKCWRWNANKNYCLLIRFASRNKLVVVLIFMYGFFRTSKKGQQYEEVMSEIPVLIYLKSFYFYMCF